MLFFKKRSSKKRLSKKLNELPRLAPNSHILKATGYDSRAVVLDATVVFFSLVKAYPNLLRKLRKSTIPALVIIALISSIYLRPTTIEASSGWPAVPAEAGIEIQDFIISSEVPVFQRPVPGALSQHFWWGHRAVDIPNPVGTPVRAAAEGTVTFAGWSNGGFGNSVTIVHADGFVSRYAHLSRVLVKAGDKVDHKTIVGLVGATGNATGSHLHFEIVYNGVLVDPEKFLPPTYTP